MFPFACGCGVQCTSCALPSRLVDRLSACGYACPAHSSAALSASSPRASGLRLHSRCATAIKAGPSPRPALKPPAHGGSTGMPLLPANAGHLPPHLKSAHKPACLCVTGTPRGPGRRQRPTKSFEPHARSTMIMGPCSARRRPPRRGNPACKSL